MRRRVADLACRLLLAILPRHLKEWGVAIRYETESIASDDRALLFAIGSLLAMAPRAIVARAGQALAAPFSVIRGPTEGSVVAQLAHALGVRPRALGTMCGIGAVSCGAAYMAMANAPASYVAINFAALALGLAILWAIGRGAAGGFDWTGAVMPLSAIALLATALLGAEADGAARWVDIAGFAIQPSLVLLPVALIAFAVRRDALALGSILVALAAVAIQPDRAMAGMGAAALTALALMHRERKVIVVAATAIAGFLIAMAQPDTLPASAFVDQILYSSFEVETAAGIAVLCGSVLLVVPAIAGWIMDRANRPIYAMFGAVWSSAVVAAALGNYPTPLVGYGGSAIIGYALSLLALPRSAIRTVAAKPATGEPTRQGKSDRQLMVGLT